MSSGLPCAVCGGMCEERMISLALPRSESGMAVFRNVPAEVCVHCGETRFSLCTAGRLMAVVRRNEPPAAVTEIPVYDLD